MIKGNSPVTETLICS